MDDDVIQELREGQDMVLQVTEISADSTQMKREWDAMTIDPAEGDTSPQLTTPPGYELRLTF
jgi:hypothetical protein